MIKNLVVFGCSWAYGDELIDPALASKGVKSFDALNDQYRQANAFPGLISTQLNLTLEDVTWNGASLQSMLWSFEHWLNHSTPEHIAESIVLIALTDEARVSWFDKQHNAGSTAAQAPAQRYIHSDWIRNGIKIRGDDVHAEYWNQLNIAHKLVSDSPEYREMNYNTIVRSFDGIAARNNITMLQFNVLSQNYKLKVPTLIESSSALEMLVIRNKPRKEPLFCVNQHPNEKGHSIISEFLIKHITDVIIRE